MPEHLDLASLPWTCTGVAANSWHLTISNELGLPLNSDTPAVPFAIPGSVQGALRRAGVLPDWTIGLNSRACEWVEHRDWLISTDIPAEWSGRSGRTVLACDGIDGFSEITVDKTRIGSARDSFGIHCFDLSEALRAPGAHRLTIIFTGQPRGLGQIGHTSRITEWKNRYSYGWDWTPRVVQLAITDGIRLEHHAGPRLTSVSCIARLDCVSDQGLVQIRAAVADNDPSMQLRTSVRRNGELIAQRSEPAHLGGPSLAVAHPARWWPNGYGAQDSYDVTLELLTHEGSVLDQTTRRIGFRDIAWQQCQDAPAGALPWICVVNGRKVFLQGANWVPPETIYADVSTAKIRALVTTYRNLGCTVLRVWGGAALAHRDFYEACDEAGILVWQEFPLSSSGPDNTPPDDAAAIAALTRIASSYIHRRQHHPSLLLWCGGNELQSALSDDRRPGAGRPWGEEHPTLAALARTVAELDPGRRFLPASSSGPRFMADAADFGKGLHHDVHGPWDSNGTEQEWREYWRNDDSLFRSEAGVPGAGPKHLIERTAGALAMPPDRTNPLYLHLSAWWLQGDRWRATGGNDRDLDAYVRWSQQRQADLLAIAVNACHERFPRCGGIILWMGHDCFPCPINTSIIDAEGQPKPSGIRIGELFRAMNQRCASTT